MTRNFDRVAAWFEPLERTVFPFSMRRCREAFLGDLSSATAPPRRALLAGDGDGRFALRLLCAVPTVEVTIADSSRGMLERARQRIDAAGSSVARRAQFRQLDLVQCSGECAPAAFDLITTHFFLDCFDAAELEAVVARLGRLAAPEATWLWSDFSLPNAGPGRLLARAQLGALYPFFRRATGISARRLPEHSGALEAAGFRRAARVEVRAGTLAAERWTRVDTDARGRQPISR